MNRFLTARRHFEKKNPTVLQFSFSMARFFFCSKLVPRLGVRLGAYIGKREDPGDEAEASACIEKFIITFVKEEMCEL